MKLIAITSCSTGIAHTYMAAEALEIAAKDIGWNIKVETQGSVGAKNVLTQEDIEAADAVVIAASTSVNKDRFHGKRLYEVDVNDAIKNGQQVLKDSLQAPIYGGAKQTETIKVEKESNNNFKGIYAHLMTGVSYMIPFVVAGGIMTALSFAFGGINSEGAIAEAFKTIGGTAMGLMWAALGGYVAFSISDRPGLVPGMVAGMLASSSGSGFLGALLGGFIAGYSVLGVKKAFVKLPEKFEGLMPVLIIPVLSCIITGFLMVFVVGKPLTWLNEILTSWLTSMSGASSVVLGVILGAMMAIDLAGPIGKAAYFFGVASLTALTQGQTSPVMAAVMLSGMVPPLAMALSSTVLAKKKYTRDERESGKTAWILGLSFISEGAIPFAVADPIRVLASVTVGSAITGALSMVFNCGLAVPHGGFFVLLIPGATSNVFMMVLALAVGTVVSALLVSLWKKEK